MAEIYDCVKALKNLLNVQYEFLLGHKGNLVAIQLQFHKLHFYHLMGFQYIKDVRQLNGKSEIVFDKLYNHEIKEEIILASKQYSKISSRIKYLCFLEKILDDNKTVFKYNKENNSFSLIQADFLLKNELEEKNIFVFLSKDSGNTYFCRSFFPETHTDYSKGQTNWTLLSKKKIFKREKTETLLFVKESNSIKSYKK